MDLLFSFLGGAHAISKGWLNMQPVAERSFVLLYGPTRYGPVALKLPTEEDTRLPTIQTKQGFLPYQGLQHDDPCDQERHVVFRCRNCRGTNIVISDEDEDAADVVLATLQLRHDMQCLSKSFAARIWENKRFVSHQLQCGRCRAPAAYVYDLLSHHDARQSTFQQWIGIGQCPSTFRHYLLRSEVSTQSMY